MYHFYFNFLRRFMNIVIETPPAHNEYTDEIPDKYTDELGNQYVDEVEL